MTHKVAVLAAFVLSAGAGFVLHERASRGGNEQARIDIYTSVVDVYPDLESLVKASEFILIGDVVEQETATIPAGRGAAAGVPPIPVTRSTINVVEVIDFMEGDPPATFIVEQFGSREADSFAEEVENPLYRVGERSLFFVTNTGAIDGLPNLQPLGGGQGRFRVVGGRVYPIVRWNLDYLSGEPLPAVLDEIRSLLR